MSVLRIDPHGASFIKHRTDSCRNLPVFFLRIVVFSLSMRRRFCVSHSLRDKASHPLRRALLHLFGSVGIGREGEACVVMAQHTGHGFHVNAVLQSDGGECVSEIMEANVGQTGVLEDFLVQVHTVSG